MKFKKLSGAIFVLAVALSFMAIFAACTSEGDGNPSENHADSQGTSEETAPEEEAYPEFIIEVTYDDGGRIHETMPNYVFIPDEAIGTWQAVDVVQAIEDFDSNMQYTNYLVWHRVIFFDEGKVLVLTVNFQNPIFTETWTKGYIVVDKIVDKFIMKYTTKKIENDVFLFIEDRPIFQNVDQPPTYMVFKKTSEKPELVFGGHENVRNVRNSDLSLIDFSGYSEYIIYE